MKLFSVKIGITIIGIVVLGCAGMRGERESWRSFISTDLYEGFYYVTKSHLLYKGTLSVAVKLIYTDKGKREFGKGYENLSYSLQSWQVNCPTKKQSILSSSQHSVEGNLIDTKLPKAFFLRSVEKTLSEAVCK